jgi:predicted MPP superfamily phosphohydrolase
MDRSISAQPFHVPDEVIQYLEKRMGRMHSRLRLGIERDHEAQIFGQGRTFFHIENFPASRLLIESILKFSGLYWIAKKNASRVALRRNLIVSRRLPQQFNGYKILHLSDLHLDISQPAMISVAALVRDLDYDLCIITGDFRGLTYGDITPCLRGLERLMDVLKGPVFGVLGNHDTIRMVPDIEAMGIRMLLNEWAPVDRGEARICIAGIDDAHFYRVDNIEKAAQEIPTDAFSILLSHTPEIYRQAAHADFDVLLCGHTHGGQICLPAGIPITLDAAIPRTFGRGAWKYRDMAGYTSVGAGSSVAPVRLNCQPEITLHCLHCESVASDQ